MTIPATRPLNLAGFLACVGMMAYALYAEHYMLLSPCPLCVFQRMAVIALGIILMLAANLFQGRLLAGADDDIYDSLEMFSTALDTVRKEYVREVSSEKLIQGALNGMLRSLDQHSSYISPQMYSHLMMETEGGYEGVGIQLEMEKLELVMETATGN